MNKKESRDFFEWDEDRCPLLNGVLLENGSIIYLEIERTEGARIVKVTREGYGSISQFLLEKPDNFTAANEFCSLTLPERGLRISAGGGSWGGDGFVVSTDLMTGRVIWLASFDDSNEFEKLGIKNSTVIAETNLFETWEFPLDAPEDLRVFSSDGENSNHST